MSGSSRYEIDIIANNKASAALGKVDKQLKNIQGSSGKVNNSFNKMKIAAGLAAGAFAAFKAGQAFLETAKQVENLGIQLKFITGSAELGAQALKTVEEAASRSAFSLESMANAAPLLLTVSSIDQLNDSLDMAGDIAAATGMSLEEAAGQLQRAFSGGIASADIFREKGVKSMLGFQEGVKYTAEETEKMIRDAFENGTTTIAGAAAEMAKTWDGQMSMMADSWFKFKKKTMDSGLFAAMKRALQAIRQVIADNQYAIDGFATALGEGLATAVDAIATSITFIGEHAAFFAGIVKTLVAYKLAGWLWTAAKAMRGLNIAMMMNPIGAVVGSIALLIGYFVGQNGLGRTIVQVQAAFEVLGEAMSTFGRFIKEKMVAVLQFFGDKFNWLKDKMVAIWNTIAKFIPGAEKFAEVMADAGEVVGGAFAGSLDYAKGKAGDFQDKLADLMPDGLVRTIDDVSEAIKYAGLDYDIAAQKAEEFAETQRRLTEQSMKIAGPIQGISTPGAGVEPGKKGPLDEVTASANAAKEAVLSFSEKYAQFFSNTVKDAAEAADMIVFKQMAVKQLGEELKAGTLNIDTYAQAMVDLGIVSKKVAEETDNTAERIQSITDSLFPAEAQIARYKEQISFLDTQLASLSISEEEHLRLTKAIKEQIDETSGATAEAAEKNKALVESLQGYKDHILRIAEANLKLKEANDAIATSLEQLDKRLFPVQAKINAIEADLALVQAAYDSGSISIDKYKIRVVLLKQELAATQPVLGEYKDRILRIAEAQNLAADAALKLKNELTEQANSIQALEDRYDPMSAAIRRTNEDLAEAAELYKGREDMQAYKDLVDNIMKSQTKLQESMNGTNVAIDNTGKKFKETTEDMRTDSEKFVDGFNEDFNRKFADGLVNGTLGFETFAGSLKSMLSDLLTDFLNGGNMFQDIMSMFGGLFGGNKGGGLSSLFDTKGVVDSFSQFAGDAVGGHMARNLPMFADGGRLGAGKLGIVGEGGQPELITGPANITPFDQLQNGGAGGGDKPQVNITIQAIDTQTGTEFLLKNRKQVEGIIQSAYNKRGKQGIY